MYRIKDTRNLLILLIIYFFLLVKVSYAGNTQYSPPFHTHQISIYTTVDGLPSGFINCMDQDHEENLWIGTLNGVSKFDGKSFTNYGVKQGFTNKAVTAILCDNKGYTWCGIIDGSLFRFDGLEWEQMQEIQKMISAQESRQPGMYYFLYTDKSENSENIVWGGSPYIPVFNYHNKDFTLFDITGRGMIGNTEGDIFIIDSPFLRKIDTRTGKQKIIYNFMTELTDISIISNEIIISTSNEISIYNVNYGNSYDQLFGEKSSSVFSKRMIKSTINDLFIDINDNIWCATSDVLYYIGKSKSDVELYSGVAEMRTYEWYYNTTGLPGGECTNIFQDHERHIWLCTSTGLVKIDMVSPRIILPGHIPGSIGSSKLAFSFKGDDGRYGSSVDMLSYTYKYANEETWNEAKNGNVYLTGLKDKREYTLNLRVIDGVGNYSTNIVSFYIDYDNTIPVAEITNKEDFILPVKVTEVTFRFTVSDNQTPQEKLNLFCRLEKDNNIIKNWTGCPDKTKITYKNLDVGSYSFIIKAIDESGNESEPDRCFFIMDPEAYKPKIILKDLCSRFFTEYSNRPVIRKSPIRGEIASGRISFIITPMDTEKEKRDLQYSNMIVPYDNEWSGFVAKNQYDRKDIPDGIYTLKVRARAQKQFVSEVKEVTFKVIGNERFPRTKILNTKTTIYGKWVTLECDAGQTECYYSYSLDGYQWSRFIKSGRITFPGPSDGLHTVRVVAKNEYGIDPSPAEFSFYYEWVPDTPIANIRTSIPDVMEQRTITIAFEGKDDMNVGDKTGAYELDYSYRLIPRYMDWSLKSRKDSVTFTKLKNGPYFFQVRAIDKNGNESIVPAEKLFEVRVIPFFMQSWFYIILSILGICLAVFLSMYYTTFKIKRDIYNQRYNPYIVGEAVHDPDMFFGRDSLIKDIFISLNNNSLCLLGERRIGKTSLLEHIEKNAQPPFFSFFCNLEAVKEENFFSRIMNHLVNKIRATWKDTGFDLVLFDKEQDLYEDMDFEEDLNTVITYLQNIYSPDMSIIMCLDEIDATQDFSPTIHQSLRNIFQTYKGTIRMVSAGVSIKRGDWQLPTSPWYNFFEFKHISGLATQDAELLITKPVKGFYSYTRKAIDYILAKTDKKPFYIQTICKKVISRLLDQKQQKVVLEDVRVIYEDFVYKELNREFEIFRESLSSKLQKAIIQVVKGDEYTFSKDMEKSCYLNPYNHAHKVITIEDGTLRLSTPFFDWCARFLIN